MRASFLLRALPLSVIFACSVACSSGSRVGTVSSSATSDPAPIALDGSESLTVSSGAGGNGLPACPKSDGVVREETIVVDLADKTATRTTAFVDCAASVPYQTPATKRSTTTVALRPEQRDAVIVAVESMAVRQAGRCWIDGDDSVLAIRRSGIDMRYKDESSSYCDPVVGMVSDDAMQKVLAAATALF